MCRTDELKELLNAFVDGGFETPPLCTAAEKGDVELVMLLLDKVGVDKNFKDTDGETPLILAAFGGHLPVAEALLAAGVDVDTIGATGTALHIAVLEGFDGIVDALLKKGANTELRDDDNRTALMDAAQFGHLHIVKALLAAHADVSARDSDGDTALHISASRGHEEIVDALLDAGADKNCADDHMGATPLHLAAYNSLLRIMNTLVAAGVDVNARDDDGNTALHVSARAGKDAHGHLTVMETLLASGADVNIATNDGDTALHFAVESAVSVDMTRLLLLRGADENALDSGGRTPAQVRLLLDRAPADRRWRRRGWLVMLRSRTLKAGEAGCEGGDGGYAGARSVKQRGGDGREVSDLVSVVAKLGVVEKDVFCSVVPFL
ncbi:unnamed protein product [Ectocarpus sp. 8 AP-2014]